MKMKCSEKMLCNTETGQCFKSKHEQGRESMFIRKIVQHKQGHLMFITKTVRHKHGKPVFITKAVQHKDCYTIVI